MTEEKIEEKQVAEEEPKKEAPQENKQDAPTPRVEVHLFGSRYWVDAHPAIIPLVLQLEVMSRMMTLKDFTATCERYGLRIALYKSADSQKAEIVVEGGILRP